MHMHRHSIMLDSLCLQCFFFFFKQKTAYEMRISDWSSDVCSSDLQPGQFAAGQPPPRDDIVLLRDIPLRSTCEHHMAPIRGVAHVAYLPGERVVEIGRASCRERVCQYV